MAVEPEVMSEPEEEEVVDRSVLFKDGDAIGELAKKLQKNESVGQFAAEVLKLSNMGTKQFDHFDAGSIKELDLAKAVGHLSAKQKLLLTFFAEKVSANKTVEKEDCTKVARCLVGAECHNRGVIDKTKDSDVLLNCLKYLAAGISTALFENVLLEVAISRTELLEHILMLKPAKTLEVGYLQVRQIKKAADLE